MNVALTPVPDSQTIHLRLYVTGQTASAQRAQNALKALVANHCEDDFRVQVIDVLSNPEAAVRDNVYATPTIIRSDNGIERRLIGDLSSSEKIEVGLLLEARS